MTSPAQPVGPRCLCGGPMVLRETQKYAYQNGTPRRFWGCAAWETTRCPGIVGAHPDGSPVGTPADAPTKEARIRAHAIFDALWQGGRMTRGRAYKWMRTAMGLTKAEAHIGHFDKARCDALIALCERRIARNERERTQA